MSNITKFTQDKQIMVSELQMRRLLEFVRNADNAFNQLYALASVLAEKSESHSINKTLAQMAIGICNTYSDECLEEVRFFKEESKQLIPMFAEELAA
ncbi:hypothetical protein [Acinetobacter sp. Ver3]|uniref:hypothetical protein n=1 Tax=Acinetobacter sp. Ver3 TaxID=466088 RepID=UPI000447BEB0|nr:hypothetical protein [Acinetobacter sp. Ver3]EZQ10733.1 hypothetical protein CL42_06250 [Acinetobacter sp. Ver3]